MYLCIRCFTGTCIMLINFNIFAIIKCIWSSIWQIPLSNHFFFLGEPCIFHFFKWTSNSSFSFKQSSWYHLLQSRLDELMSYTSLDLILTPMPLSNLEIWPIIFLAFILFIITTIFIILITITLPMENCVSTSTRVILYLLLQSSYLRLTRKIYPSLVNGHYLYTLQRW